MLVAASLSYAQSSPDSALVRSADSSTIKNFSVNSNNNRVYLQWRTESADAEIFFTIERSTNGVDFSPIGILKNTAFAKMEFVDDATARGKAYYRVRLNRGDNASYSDTLFAGGSAEQPTCKFYPNPVDKMLIVKSEFPVEVQIADQSGKSAITAKLDSGLKVIDVSQLQPGVYFIAIFQKNSNIIISEKLVKK